MIPRRNVSPYPRNNVAIHLLLLFFTVGIGNIVYWAVTAHKQKQWRIFYGNRGIQPNLPNSNEPSQEKPPYSVSPHKDFDSMSGSEFERYCAELLKKNGFSKVQVTNGSGDHGVDILAEKESVTYAIQCKCYSSNIGNKAVQEIFSGKDFYKRHVGVVLTNQYFTPAAKEAAERTGIILWDRSKLKSLTEDPAVKEAV